MTYGNLIDGNIIPAPNPLVVGRSRVYNPAREQYAAHGWLPIVDTPMPDTPEGEEPKYYTYHRDVVDGQIVRAWTETEPPEPETETVPIPIELTPAEKRELAYNTVSCIEWDGSMLTVTQAAQQWAYYAAEGRTDKTDTLTALIAAAKQNIREQ